jgi:DNA repair exonuclease SbcCD ATPase subunit
MKAFVQSNDSKLNKMLSDVFGKDVDKLDEIDSNLKERIELAKNVKNKLIERRDSPDENEKNKYLVFVKTVAYHLKGYTRPEIAKYISNKSNDAFRDDLFKDWGMRIRNLNCPHMHNMIYPILKNEIDQLSIPTEHLQEKKGRRKASPFITDNTHPNTQHNIASETQLTNNVNNTNSGSFSVMPTNLFQPVQTRSDQPRTRSRQQHNVPGFKFNPSSQ